MDALVAASERGIKVKALMDTGHVFHGRTAAMPERVRTLIKAGVDVRKVKGITGCSGIQHSKTIFADDHLLIGSCNWTTASRSNHESDAVISLSAYGKVAWTAHFAQRLVQCEPLTTRDCDAGQAHRDGERPAEQSGTASSSTSTQEIGATQRKFTIAAARKKERLAAATSALSLEDY